MTLWGCVGMSPVLLGEPPHVDAQGTALARRLVPAQRGTRAKLRVGVVGLGKQALDDHIPGIAASDAADLVAVCDDDDNVLREQGSLGVASYREFRQMITAEQLDFVVVTVPHNVGAAVVEAAAERGVHVLKEKPFATTLTEARRLAQVCSDAGIELMVTLQRRFNPIYTSFPQLADNRDGVHDRGSVHAAHRRPL